MISTTDTTAMDAAIEVRELTKRYGGTLACDSGLTAIDSGQ